MSVGRQDQLLGQIYDAAFDPGSWPAVMTELAKELSGEAACMTSLDIVTGEGGGYTALVPDGTMETYVSSWSQSNPLHQIEDPLAYLANWRPATIRYEDWVEQDALRRSDFYNEFLRPIGSENGIMMGLAIVGTDTVTMNIARPLHRGMFDDQEIAKARRWQEHLSRAVRLGRSMQVNQTVSDAFDHCLATMPHVLYFLDGRGRVRQMSAAAEAMLAADSVLRVSNGVLSATLPQNDGLLRRLISQASGCDGEPPSGGTMSLQGRGGKARELTVSPLGPRSIATWSSEPTVLVSVSSNPGPEVPLELRFRARFGLTPAEAKVTVALMRGGTLREIADDAAISIHTVRAQLGSIFSKTGCQRQADLIRTLMIFNSESDDRGEKKRPGI